MGIKEELGSVLALQREYSSDLNEAMIARGQLIRHSLPASLALYSEDMRVGAGLEPGDLLIEGRDGLGRRSLVPWVRFASKNLSPRATLGWYVVFLFREDGAGVYLALAHASKEGAAGGFVARSESERRRLVRWARDLLIDEIGTDDRLSNQMELGQGDLALAYESTTAASYYYPSHDLPNELQISSDLRAMAGRLGRIYASRSAQIQTGETSLDVISALDAIELATSGRAFRGQGYGLTPAERRVVELQAMAAATKYFSSQGYEVQDTSSHQSYDLKLTRGLETAFVEVKGTTGQLGDVVLTRNEVDHHLACYPNNALFVLHGIKLSDSTSGPTAKGGISNVQMPWRVDQERLQPIAYRYRIE